MITSIKLFKENLFVPHNLENRAEKLKQETIKMLQQEHIDYLELEPYMLDLDPILIKLKTSYNVEVSIDVNRFPKWLENVTILQKPGDVFSGDVDLRECNFTSLQYSPKRVEGSFLCNYNNLTSLKGAPEYVGRRFCCNNNDLSSLQYGPKFVGDGYLCYDNAKTFTVEDVKQYTEVKGDIICIE